MNIDYTLTESWIAVGLAFLATGVWRFIGVLLAGKISTDGLLMNWINTVAYAMVAAVMMQILVYPSGILATTSLLERLIGLFIGIITMLISKKLLLAIIAGIMGFAITVNYF